MSIRKCGRLIVAHLNECPFSLNNLQPRHTFVLVFIVTLFLWCGTLRGRYFCTPFMGCGKVDIFITPLSKMLSFISLVPRRSLHGIFGTCRKTCLSFYLVVA